MWFTLLGSAMMARRTSTRSEARGHEAMLLAFDLIEQSPSRTRFIPEKLLGLFEQTAWPPMPIGTAARTAGRGPKVDIGARMRGMWR